MSFRIEGLSPDRFRHLFGLSDEALAQHNAVRHVATNNPGLPDRICLRDLDIGESAILLNYEHLPTSSPYRSSHAIYVWEDAKEATSLTDIVPDVMKRRMIALRAFDEADMMLTADLATGEEIAATIKEMFSASSVRYIHAHYAKQGCFAARIDRA
ncbi:Protein of unknown function [Cohaesibacter sp. ES.047]|uniref:DUF1203 domain-containing protein n=1 Tax=Cohaesibacter sp. ES.047 TaxID=1798205 RepID=UPI000BB99A9D|nr:DUF1203 domain-containing protein [Cohaesibacter sp. ES.047]SNY93292.1 Protein of unknown function [Cohaesibacter sp. ES.047]